MKTIITNEEKLLTSLISINGYYWSGFWDGKHHFVKREEKGFLEIKATDEDIENGNIVYMCNNQLSNEKL